MRIAAVIAVGTALCLPVAAQTDPFAGTWKMNISKSQLLPPPLTSSTMTIVPTGDGETVTGESVDVNGTRRTTSYTAKFDGKDYPNTANGQVQKSVLRVRQVDQRTREMTQSIDGRTTAVIRRELSSDGKSMTSTMTRTRADGTMLKEVRVWERQ